MRFICQRVLEAQVSVNNEIVSQIDRGLLVYLSVGKDDTEEDAIFMSEKIINLRIYTDNADKMNLSLKDVGGSALLISNFTLHGDCRKGRRPGFDAAAKPELAKKLYEKVGDIIADNGVSIKMGIFAAHMHVKSINDGPINIILDSKRVF